MDIRCPRPQDIMEHLCLLSEIKEAALFGAGIHAVVHDPDSARAAIRNEFEARGHNLESVERIIPSMEDVFVSLIEVQEKNSFSL